MITGRRCIPKRPFYLNECIETTASYFVEINAKAMAAKCNKPFYTPGIVLHLSALSEKNNNPLIL